MNEVQKGKRPIFLGFYAKPGPIFGKLLGSLLIIIGIGMYLSTSAKRHKENPDDKITPSVQQMYQEMKTITTIPDKRSGKNFFIEDTKTSLRRLVIGVSIAATFAYVVGILMGMFPGIWALLNTTMTGLSNINPMIVLVFVLIALGIGEQSKIFLIAFGIGIPMTRNLAEIVKNLPTELTVKAVTLGANQFQVIYRIIAPQMFPRLIDIIRMFMGSAWVYLVAGEAIASTEGLGYRVYLQMRYMNLALIIPYAAYMCLLAYVSDLILQGFLKLKWFRWYGNNN